MGFAASWWCSDQILVSCQVEAGYDAGFSNWGPLNFSENSSTHFFASGCTLKWGMPELPLVLYTGMCLYILD
jgi:hypothetical protein